MKQFLKKIGKAIWSALPWICMTIGLTCWLSLPYLYAKEGAKLESQVAALEAKSEMYEAEKARLENDVKWLRSLVEQHECEETGDGQTQ